MAIPFETWGSIAFLMLGLLLIFFEVFQPGFFIAVPGGALAFGGAIGLVAPHLMYGQAGWIMWPLLIGIATALNLVAYKMWAPAGTRPITLSIDSLPGEQGEVTVAVAPDHMRGKVRIRGASWSARSTGAQILPGTRVVVVRAEGVHVIVEPALAPAPHPLAPPST